MSRSVVMRHILGTTRMILPEFPYLSVFRYLSKKNSTLKHFGKGIEKSKDLSHTTVIIQDRLDIQEVPTIVRKLQNLDVSEQNDKVSDITSTNSINVNKYGLEEEQEIKDGLKKCCTLKELYVLLEILPDCGVTSNIAICALKKIIELENNVVYRNKMRQDKGGDERSQILGKLLNFVIADSESSLLLETLSILSRDTVGACSDEYKEKLINEVLIRASDRKFNIQEMCDIVNVLSDVQCENIQEYVDELWTGFLDRAKDINENNIRNLFSVLPKLKQSRKMVFNMLERKCDDLWWRLPTSAVVEILTALQNIHVTNPHIFELLSRNISANIHDISEDDLLQIVTCFATSYYIDERVKDILEKYVKTKGSKVKNTALLTAILDYCVNFRLRTNTILEVCAEYLVKNSSNFNPVSFKSFFMAYGYFNYRPSKGVKFWQIVEHYIQKRFVQFKPDDIIDIALSCIYLEKFPLNFTKSILNPYFLDRMHSCTNGTELQKLRTKLKIFDTAMTLECPQYQGPQLPRDYAVKTVSYDGRIKSVVKNMYDIVSDIVGSCNRVSTGILLSQLPTSDMYLIDILLHPVGMANSLNTLITSKDQDLLIAILIHLPEHYCSEERHLIGVQEMKIRHLKCLGLNVIGLKYTELKKLRGKNKELRQYLIDLLGNVEKCKY